MALDRRLEELITATRRTLEARATGAGVAPPGGCSGVTPEAGVSEAIVPTALSRAEVVSEPPPPGTGIHDNPGDAHELPAFPPKPGCPVQALPRQGERVAAEPRPPLEGQRLKDHPSLERTANLECGEAAAASLTRTISSEAEPLELPPEITALVETTRLKYHPALGERRLTALRAADPETQARLRRELEDLEGYRAQAGEIRAEAEAMADLWLPELERFILGRTKTKIVRAVAVLMLEARLWSYGGAEHFFCVQPEIAGLAGISLRSLQRHLSPRDPRAHLLARWISRRAVYGSRRTGEASRVGTVYRFRLEAVGIENLEPCPRPRLEALRAPWRGADELPMVAAVARQLAAETAARWRADGTPVLDGTRQHAAGSITFSNQQENANPEWRIQIEGVHLASVHSAPVNSYTRQSRLEHQLAQNLERAEVGREPTRRLEAARLESELIAERFGAGSAAHGTALRGVQRLEDELALTLLPLPRLGAFKRLDDDLERRARAVVQRLGDRMENLPFWKATFKRAGSDSRVFAAVSQTLEAAREKRVRTSLPKYCVGVLKRSGVISPAVQAVLLEPVGVETTEIRV